MTPIQRHRYLVLNNMRHCCKCKQDLPLEAFSPNSKTTTRCMVCTRQQSKEQYHRDPKRANRLKKERDKIRLAHLKAAAAAKPSELENKVDMLIRLINERFPIKE